MFIDKYIDEFSNEFLKIITYFNFLNFIFLNFIIFIYFLNIYIYTFKEKIYYIYVVIIKLTLYNNNIKNIKIKK